MERSDIPRDEGVPSGSACQRHGPKDLGGDEGDIHHFGVQASVYLCSTTMRLHRSIAILLLGVFLSNTMEAHQFLKLPALFEHLSEHQADSPTSWAEFILNALGFGVSAMDECMLGRNEVNDVWQPPRS